MNFELTQEQKAAVELSHQVSKLKLNAAAGASKTTTCSLIAEANPCPSLYLAYNKTMADDALGRFPSWVEVRTTHSLAYKTLGRKYAHKLVRPAGDYQNVGWTGSEVARLLHIPSFIIPSTRESIGSNTIGSCVIATINKFEHSDDVELDKKHVSISPIPVKKAGRFDCPWKKIKAEILSSAKKLWKKRIDVSSPVLISHDTYLKLYQLSKPDLSNYEMIYLDEYQDTNACVHAIAKAQTKTNLVAVGDRFQAIYGWRGATNMLDRLDWPTSELSKSFRFSQELADVANIVLRDNDTGKARTNIVGFENAKTQVLSKQQWYDLAEKPTPVTKIYRTNSNLIADAIDDIIAGKKVAIQIDVRNFVKCLESGLALMQGDKAKVKHDVFLGFDNWKEFTEEAEVDPECGKLLRIITGGDVGKILTTLRVYTVPKKYEIKYSTAHKMKGLEDDTIILADDFPSPFNKDGNWVGLEQEEQNLLYVALTRARRMLIKNITLEEILGYYNEKNDEIVVEKIKEEDCCVSI